MSSAFTKPIQIVGVVELIANALVAAHGLRSFEIGTRVLLLDEDAWLVRRLPVEFTLRSQRSLLMMMMRVYRGNIVLVVTPAIEDIVDF